jgi:3-hydroxybutyryl-CoA dehydrogenase
MKIAVIGFGMMGRQIAQVFAQHDHIVHVTDENSAILKAGLDEIVNGTFGIMSMVQKGKISKQDATNIFDRIRACNSIHEAGEDADIVIEAVYENIELKQEIFHKLDQITSRNAILASNTSTLSIDKIAAKVRNKERVLGLHFFNPAQLTKLVEIVEGKNTSRETTLRAKAVVADLAKTPVIAKDEPGFVANRLGLSLFTEASKMFEQGIATVKDIDTAMKLGFNHPMGPFELADFVGLDTRLRNLESMFDSTGDTKWIPPKILRQMVNQGYLGDPHRKKGSKGGYYTINNESDQNLSNQFIETNSSTQ